MMLYSTELFIEDFAIPYEVYKEGDRLFYKPAALVNGLNTPIFWLRQDAGNWEPINLQDINLLSQIKADISRHYRELGGIA